MAKSSCASQREATTYAARYKIPSRENFSPLRPRAPACVYTGSSIAHIHRRTGIKRPLVEVKRKAATYIRGVLQQPQSVLKASCLHAAEPPETDVKGCEDVSLCLCLVMMRIRKAIFNYVLLN